MEGRTNFGDTSVQATSGDIKRLKLKANQSVRVVFTSEEVISRLRHYKKNAGYRRCLSYTGFCPACIAADPASGPLHNKEVKRANEIYTANVFVYDTTPDCANLNQSIGAVHIFSFGADKFTQIRTIKSMYGSIIGLDLMITCTDEAFQKYSIQAYPREMSIYNTMPDIKDFIDKAFARADYPLEKLAAKEVNAKQLVIDFGLNPMILETPEAKKFINLAPETPAAPAMAVPTPTMPQTAPQAAPQHNVPFNKVNSVGSPTTPGYAAQPAYPLQPGAQAPQPMQTAPAAAAPVNTPQPPAVDMSSLLDEL